MQPQVLFEDDQLLAIRKEPFLHCETRSHDLGPTLESWAKSRGLIPAHRLDFETSGVYLLTKGELTFLAMRKLFKERKIEKYYSAWSGVHPNQTEIQVFPRSIHDSVYDLKSPLINHPKSKKRVLALSNEILLNRYRNEKKIEAHTRILRVTPHTSHPACNVSLTRFDLQIFTGVRHQIRVHLASLGFPLFGDALYSQTKEREQAELWLDPTHARHLLHATRLVFELNQRRYQIEDPAP